MTPHAASSQPCPLRTWWPPEADPGKAWQSGREAGGQLQAGQTRLSPPARACGRGSHAVTRGRPGRQKQNPLALQLSAPLQGILDVSRGSKSNPERSMDCCLPRDRGDAPGPRWSSSKRSCRPPGRISCSPLSLRES